MAEDGGDSDWVIFIAWIRVFRDDGGEIETETGLHWEDDGGGSKQWCGFNDLDGMGVIVECGWFR